MDELGRRPKQPESSLERRAEQSQVGSQLNPCVFRKDLTAPARRFTPESTRNIQNVHKTRNFPALEGSDPTDQINEST